MVAVHRTAQNGLDCPIVTLHLSVAMGMVLNSVQIVYKNDLGMPWNIFDDILNPLF